MLNSNEAIISLHPELFNYVEIYLVFDIFVSNFPDQPICFSINKTRIKNSQSIIFHVQERVAEKYGTESQNYNTPTDAAVTSLLVAAIFVAFLVFLC
jgi:hypothetical protein